MNLLGAKLYDPATAVSVATTAATAMAAFDTTNLRITFTVPAHGYVLVRMATNQSGATSVPQLMLGVLEGSTVRGRVVPVGAPVGASGTTTNVALVAEFVVAGLSAGSVTWDAAWACETGVASTAIHYGGPNNTTANDAWGAFCFEIWDPRPLPTAANGASTGLPILGANTGDVSFTASSANTTAVSFTGTGTGHGILATSGNGATGNGIQATANSTNGSGLSLAGKGSGAGLYTVGGSSSGNGLQVVGGGSGAGVSIAAQGAGNGAGVTIAAGGTGHGINVTGGATSGNGINATGGGTGSGLVATSGSGSTGDGIKGVAASTNGNGFSVTGTGTGNGLLATGGASSGGDGLEAVAGGGVPIRGNITANITGDLSGSVGSVTGAVGSVTGPVGSVAGNVSGSVASVTGAVGSVTGNVGGNVVGSVASVTGNVGGLVVGSVGSVLGSVGGNVTGNVVGSVGSVSAGVTLANGAHGGAAASITLGGAAGLTGDLNGSVQGDLAGNVAGTVGSVVATVAADVVSIGGNTVDPFDAQLGVNVVSYSGGAAPLQPTVAGRTLDVSATGEAGIDWANVGGQATAVALSHTSISSVSDSVTVGAMNADVLTASALKADAATEIANAVLGSVASGALTVLDVVKILGAVIAGKSSITSAGGGAATVKFRDLADTKDAVTATVAGAARTAITLNP